MSQVTLNGLPALEGSITEPREGQWSAKVELDDDDATFAGTTASIVFAGTTAGDGTEETFTGTVQSGALEHGRFVAVIVGGADGLDTVLEAKYYHGATVKTVLDDVATGTGETLDTSIATDVSGHFLPRWQRRRGAAREALVHLARELGGFWRITRAGQLFMGRAETWPTLAVDATETERDPGLGLVMLAPADAPTARPGAAINGENVAQVVTSWDGGKLRQVLTVQREDGRPRNTTDAINAVAERAVRRHVDYARWYAAKVVQQAADGTVEIYPDDELMRGSGLTQLPLRHGIPGLTVKVKPGERCLLFFENGDPKAPCVALAPDGSSVLEVTLAVDTMLHLGGVTSEQFVALADKVDQALAKLQNAFDSHMHATAGTGAPSGPTPIPNVIPVGALSSTAATKVKAT